MRVRVDEAGRDDEVRRVEDVRDAGLEGVEIDRANVRDPSVAYEDVGGATGAARAVDQRAARDQEIEGTGRLVGGGTGERNEESDAERGRVSHAE